jgi:hypothetical protein
MKLREEIQRLRRIAPLADKRTGQLYSRGGRGLDPRKAAYKKITLYTLFTSDEGDMMTRGHIFQKREPLTPNQWAQWFKHPARDDPSMSTVDYIMKNDVLGGLSRVTGDLSKQWAVVEYIGWIGDAKYKPDDSAPRRRRNPARKKGRTRG